MLDEALLRQVQDAYEKKDIDALQNLCTPTKRTINKTQNYKSVLMLSCNNIKHLNKIENLDADCIMLNLEDGVSKEEKPFALVLCAIFLSHLQECEKKLVVRVNSLDTTGYEEIAFLNPYMPDAVRVPKIRTTDEVDTVLTKLDKNIELHLSVETKEAWSNFVNLKRSPRIKTFYLGILDLFADMGLTQELIQKENPTITYILSRFLIESKAINIKPVSFVYQKYKDLEGFREWVELEKKMGFDAKGCISPTQAKIVNKIFTSSMNEIEKAKEIIRLFEQKQSEGITGFSHPVYGFIDEPIYKGAKAVFGIEN